MMSLHVETHLADVIFLALGRIVLDNHKVVLDIYHQNKQHTNYHSVHQYLTQRLLLNLVHLKILMNPLQMFTAFLPKFDLPQSIHLRVEYLSHKNKDTSVLVRLSASELLLLQHLLITSRCAG